MRTQKLGSAIRSLLRKQALRWLRAPCRTTSWHTTATPHHTTPHHHATTLTTAPLTTVPHRSLRETTPRHAMSHRATPCTTPHRTTHHPTPHDTAPLSPHQTAPHHTTLLVKPAPMFIVQHSFIMLCCCRTVKNHIIMQGVDVAKTVAGELNINISDLVKSTGSRTYMKTYGTLDRSRKGIESTLTPHLHSARSLSTYTPHALLTYTPHAHLTV